MSDETPYTNRELDGKFDAVSEVSNNNRSALIDKIENLQNVVELRIADLTKHTADSLSRIELTTEGTSKKQDFTNGKLRKVIVALIFLAGLTIGLGLTEAKLILPLLM